MDALLGALGALFASGAGVLILILVAALAVILWSWRIAVAVAVFLQLGVGALLVHIHEVPGILIAGQLLAVTLAAAMLAIAGSAASRSPSLRRGGNWPLRISALIFVAGAWWFIDPGMTIPQFSQPETDLLLWIGICGLVIICMTGNPTFTGIAMLFWCVPLYAVAAVLLPGSGLPVLVGIAELLLALACAYLTLVEPSALGAGISRRSRWPLPSPEKEASQGGQPPAPPVPNPLTAVGRRSIPAANVEAPALVEKSA
jgi:hypothetical protein